MNTKTLRQKILDLAIHGKLVAQDPDDEPASELLKRINPQAEQTYEEELPKGWVITPMNVLCSLVDGEKQSGIERINLDVKYLRGDRRAKKTLSSGKYVAANSLLILVDGENSGEVFRTPIEGYQGSTLKQLFVNANMNIEYVLQVINLHRKELRENKVGSAIPHLNKKLFKEIEVPLPPLAEQKRIVAEIERWFALIDQIEQSKAALQATIAQAKKKILDLAIHGKLVAQDPDDEPASELLKRIKAEKEEQIKEGKIKKSKKTKTTSVPFEIPSSWEWTTLGEISNYGCCENIPVAEIGENDWVLELEDIEKDTARIAQIRLKQDRDIKGVRHKFTNGDVLYSKLRTYLNKVLVAPHNGYCTTEIVPLHSYCNVSTYYLSHVLRSGYFLDYTQQCGYGVKMPRLSTNDACNGSIPLPPLAEQKRIVKKIEELFGVLDTIQQALGE